MSLCGDVPGVAVAVARAADAQPLALAQRVKRQPHVPADHHAFRRDDVAGLAGR